MIFDDDDDDAIDWGEVGSLVTLSDFDAGDDLPIIHAIPRAGWWTTSDSEEHHLDLPPFHDGADRARWMVEQMARAALVTVEGATADDPVLPTRDGPRSLHELLRGVRGDAVDLITSFLDRE